MMNPQTIKFARRIRLSEQTQLMYVTGLDGRPVYGEDGGPAVDPDLAPVVLAALGVPPTLCEAKLGTSQFSEVEQVREWYADVLSGVGDGNFALLIGDGSNYTAAALLRNAVKRAKTVAWYDWNTFTNRYTDRITRARLLDHGAAEETADVASETYEAGEEDISLRHVYELLAIVDFDINDVRDFAVPDIVSMIRNRSSFGLTTVITVPTINSAALEERAQRFGHRGALLRLFEDEAQVFDGRQ